MAGEARATGMLDWTGSIARWFGNAPREPYSRRTSRSSSRCQVDRNAALMASTIFCHSLVSTSSCFFPAAVSR